MEKLKVTMNIKEDSQVIQDMKDAYNNSPTAVKYLAELNVPQEVIEKNYPKIYNYVNDLNYCAKCPGLKNCKKERPLLVTNLTYKSGYLDRELSPCRELLKRIEFEKHFITRDFSDYLLDYDMTSIDLRDDRKNRRQLCADYADFLSKGDNTWLYVYGVPNSGRTYCVSLITVDIAKKKRGPICFLNFPERVVQLFSLLSKDRNEFEKYMNILLNVPVLVLDDFGNEYKNDKIRDEIIFPIFSTRAKKRLFTIIISEFEIYELVDLFTFSKSGIVRAKQITNLIKSMVNEPIYFGDIPFYE